MSHQIQREILYIFSTQMKKVICEEIRDEKFCLIVDKAHDESKQE